MVQREHRHLPGEAAGASLKPRSVGVTCARRSRYLPGEAAGASLKLAATAGLAQADHGISPVKQPGPH